MNKPLIDIIICCYNSELFLRETINSVINQTYKNWRLIFVNDGSTDLTEEIINEYVRSNIPIKYYKQTNKGFGYSRQKAFELCSNDWIALLDHDDIWYPEKLKKQVEAINRYPDVGLFFSNSEWIDENGNVLRLNIENNNFNTGIINDAFDKLFINGCYIDTETVIFNRFALQIVGGFNPLYNYIADYDVFIKIAHEFDIYYDDTVFAKWRVHSSQASRKLKMQMIIEHVNLFENILESYILKNDVDNIVRNRLIFYLRKLASKTHKNNNFREYSKILLRVLKTKPNDIKTYFKIIKSFLTDFVLEGSNSERK